MATLISLKRRIQAAGNVSKTTKAMQMIAASKLKRAQEAALSTRPYVHKLTELTMQALSSKPESFTHPYLAQHTSGKELLILLSPDKGLCGGLVTSLLKEFLSYQKSHTETSYVMVGKKAEMQIAKLGKDVIANFHFGTSQPAFDMVYPLAQLIEEYYLSGKVDSVKVLYTKFNNIFTQHPQITQLLPLNLTSPEQESGEGEGTETMVFEPNVQTLLPVLLTHFVEMSLYQFILESFVSEQGARMISMQNATNNANDIIKELRLDYNKTRQAKITSEILDITGAAVALAGE
jgi:F-type H+-transporting ATPase subunit gamma